MRVLRQLADTLPFAWRQQGARWVGNHPWKAEPFSVLGQQSHAAYMARLVARPESLTGVLREFPRTAPVFQTPRSILGSGPEIRREEGLPRFCPQGIFPTEPVRVMSLAPGGLIGDEPVAYCPRTRIAVAETVRLWKGEAKRFDLFGQPRFVHPEKKAGIAFSVASATAFGFYHFLLEGLCRLALVRDWWDHFDWIVTSGSPGGFQDRWLELLGIPTEKLLHTNVSTHFHFDQLVFTDYLLRDQQPSMWNVELIRSLFPRERTAGFRWLWMSREDAPNRRLTYEAEWLERFPKFEKVLLSTLTPNQQVTLFSEAAVVAGPHGAGFTNTVFCPPCCRVLEILPAGFFDPLYARWAQAAGLQHRWVQTDFETRPAWGQFGEPLERFLNTAVTFLA